MNFFTYIFLVFSTAINKGRLLIKGPCSACKNSNCSPPWCSKCPSCTEAVNIGDDNIIIMILVAFIIIYLLFNRNKC